MRLANKIVSLFALSACGVALAEQPAPTSAPAPTTVATTTTTTTTVPPTTTTTLPPLGFTPRCPNLIQPARNAGFPESELEHLDYLGWRESRCDITADGQPRCAHNADDPAGGSYGAWQINAGHARKNRWNQHPAGFLGALGILDDPQDLCSWEVNARAAKALWDYSLNRWGWERRWWQWRI